MIISAAEDTNTKEIGGAVAPGTYKFKVDRIELMTFKSGNKGWKVELLADSGGRDVRVFDNLVKAEDCTWKWSQFARAFGAEQIDTDRPEEFVNKFGTGDFINNERGYLSVKRYHKAGKTDTADVARQSPAAMEDVPSSW